MSGFGLRGDIRTALSHMTLIGLAAILEDAGVRGLRVGWTPSLDSRPLLIAADLERERVGTAVHEHAARHAHAGDWVEAGLMSPRVAVPKEQAGWDRLAEERAAAIDREVLARHALDLRLFGALGEPAYWRFDRHSRRLPDEGASRWEMKTRNRGEEFVADRLRKLARSVAQRDTAAIVDGLTGAVTLDEAGADAIDSRTATGLAGPGHTDNAAAWCALWGLSALPVVHLVTSPSRTAGHLDGRPGSGTRRGSFCLPVPDAPMALARLRTVLVSEQLPRAAAAAPDERAPALGAIDIRAAREWLVARGVGAVVTFPVGEFGSANAPERRALAGTVVALEDGPWAP